MTLTLVSGPEILGLEEILLGFNRRKHTVQVTSEKAFLLYFSKRDFRERILIPYPSINKQLKAEYKIRWNFYDKREDEIKEFQCM